MPASCSTPANSGRRFRRSLLSILAGAALAGFAPAATIVDDSGSARDGKVGGWSSIVARNGSAAISYYCEDDHAGANGDMYALRFAWTSGGAWQWTTLDYNGGSDTSMARGTDGNYRIAYAAAGTGIGLATGSAMSWTLESVPVPPGLGPSNISMVLDPYDNPHIAYMNFANGGDHSLRYTYFDGAQWVEGGANHGIIGTGLWTPTIGFSNTQLALDAARRPHIAFAQPSDSINAYGPMTYATLPGGPNSAWQMEPLGVLGEDPSLAIGTDDIPRMAFNGAAGIIYAYKSGGAWVFETIVADSWGSSVALALSDDNVPFVSFGMTANEDMYLARRDAGGWVVTQFDGDGSPGPSVILGRYGTSVDVDETGAPHVAYQAIDIYGPTFRADLKDYGTVTGAPCIIINRSPTQQAPCRLANAAFDVEASAAGPLSYQWRKDGVELIDGPTAGGSFVTGALTSHLTISAVTEPDLGLYDCVITEQCGSVTSAAARLRLGAAATVVTPPAAVSVCAAGTAAFSVTCSGDGVPSYEWRKDGLVLYDGPTGSGSIISGATTTNLTITGVTTADAGMYDCAAYNDCGGDTSAAAMLTVTACGGGTLGDMNCDGAVDNGDIDAFVLGLLDEAAYEDAYPNCDLSNGDINDDGAMDNGDIDGFVACLLAGGCP